MAKPKIFVQIAAYRDPELQATLKDLFDRASDKRRVFVGVCLQLNKEKDKDFFDKKRWDGRVRVAHFSHTATKGAGWARAEAAKLRKGEEYTLVIDSHTRFVEGWDEKLIKCLEGIGSEKAFISTYPAAYTRPDTRDGGWNFLITPTHFDESGILFMSGKARPETDEPEKPSRGCFASARFIFAPSKMLDQVPIDPNIFFFGDEMLYSVRAFSHGWDVYHPHENFCFHHWDRGYRPTVFEDLPKWSEMSHESYGYVKRALGMEKPKGKAKMPTREFGLGKVRSLEVFQLRSGVNFAKQTIGPNAKLGIYDFNTSIAELRKRAKQEATVKKSHYTSNNEGGRDLRNRVRLLSIDYFEQGDFLERKARFKPENTPGLPEGILAIENYLDPAICQRFCEFFDRTDGHRLQVVDHEKSTKSNIVSKDDPQRITEYVPCNPIMPEIISIFIDIYANMLTPFYNVDYEWFERPQVLRYHPGGKYNRHSDSEHWMEGDIWKKVQDRDSSVLLYLNNEFEGGAIAFPNLNYKLRPKAGMLVAFPSNSKYLHEAEPVTAGKRYAIVSWASHLGVPKVMDKAPYSSIYLNPK